MRISSKQVYKMFQSYHLENPNKELWQCLEGWVIYELDKCKNWKNEVGFNTNKEIYKFLKGSE